jgi:hypothetical protein
MKQWSWDPTVSRHAGMDVIRFDGSIKSSVTSSSKRITHFPLAEKGKRDTLHSQVHEISDNGAY